MKPVRIAQLRVGDAVQNAQGSVGEVVAFTRDDVVIRWGEDARIRYTDEQLRDSNVVRFDAK